MNLAIWGHNKLSDVTFDTLYIMTLIEQLTKPSLVIIKFSVGLFYIYFVICLEKWILAECIHYFNFSPIFISNDIKRLLPQGQGHPSTPDWYGRARN